MAVDARRRGRARFRHLAARAWRTSVACAKTRICKSRGNEGELEAEGAAVGTAVARTEEHDEGKRSWGDCVFMLHSRSMLRVGHPSRALDV